MKNVAGLCVIAVGTVFSVGAGAVRAQPLFSVNDGFGSSSFNIWSTITTPQTQTGSFVASGGNPGTYAALSSTTSPTNRRATGFLYRGVGSNIFLRRSDLQITFGVDLRRTTPLDPNVPVPEVVPIIVQGINVYQPASFIPGPTSSEWTTVAPVTFDLSAFVNSSGVPLNLSQDVLIGFWIRTSGPSPLPSGTVYGVGVDNVTITIIPAPTTGVLLGVCALGMPLVTRRRRR